MELEFSTKIQDMMQECDEITQSFLGFGKYGKSQINSKIAIIGDINITKEISSLQDKLKNEYEISIISPSGISISGYLGNFKISGHDEVFSQIVSFMALNKEFGKGLHLLSEYKNENELIASIKAFGTSVEFIQNINYQSTKCQYAKRYSKARESEYCKECVKVCPAHAIIVDDKNINLEISHVDCIACGQCVGVCPSGAMSKNGDSLESISLKARLYKGKTLFVISDSDLVSHKKDILQLCSLDENILPFVVENYMFLNETYLLILLQESASNVVIFKSQGQENIYDIKELSQRIENINQIYKNIFDEDMAVFFGDIKDITSHIKTFKRDHLAHFIHTPRDSESIKDVFSQRMLYLVKDGSFGSVALRGFGEIKVDRDKCTMCLSCVGACNTGSLISQNDNFSLLFKSSLCTGCGYCMDFCSEDAIKIEEDIFSIDKNSFSYIEMAKDEPFRCVECGKIYASKKSIDKIYNMLSPMFDDAKKLRTLHCCAECKVKVMFN